MKRWKKRVGVFVCLWVNENKGGGVGGLGDHYGEVSVMMMLVG